MSIWNKILVGLICLASPFLFYSAVRALKMHQNWSKDAKERERRIAAANKEIEVLRDGTEDANRHKVPGVHQLQLAFYKMQLDQRRVWRQRDPLDPQKIQPLNVKVDRATGSAEITLTIPKPAPNNGLGEKTVVYAFEDIDVLQKGHYLGEFIVTGAKENDPKVTLVPTSWLAPYEIEKLASCKRPWTLYEAMPQDNHDLFDLLADDMKKRVLPASSVQEYLKDGKPADKSEPAERVDAQGKYVRALRDYQVLLAGERDKRILLYESLRAAEHDNELIKAALADARKQEESCKKDIAVATVELQEARRQNDVVVAHLKDLETKLKDVQKHIENLIADNQAVAAQIAKFQLEAARRIDERTRAVAKSASERR